MGLDLESRLISNGYIDHILNGLDAEALVIDNNYVIRNVNTKFLNNYKKNRNEVIGMCCYKLKADMQLPCFKNTKDCPLKRVLDTNEPVQLCYNRSNNLKLKKGDSNGKIENYRISAFPIHNCSGDVELVTEIFYDISKMKNMQGEIPKSDLKKIMKTQLGDIFLRPYNKKIYVKVLKTLLQGMGSKYGVLGIIDPFGDLLIPALSRDIWEMYHITGENIIIPHDSWNGYWGRALREQKTFCINKPFKIPKRVLPLENGLATPIVFKSSTIGLIILGDKESGYDEVDRRIMKDVANYLAPIINSMIHKESESIEINELAFNHEIEDMKYRFIFDHVANMVVSIDNDGKIIDCNKQLSKKLGYSKDELIGLEIFNLIHTQDRNKAHEIWSLLVDTKFSTVEELKLLCKDGSEINVIIYPSKFNYTNGAFIENIWIIEDITKRKEIENKLIRTCNRAEVYLDILANDIEKLNKEIASYSELLLLKPDLSEQYQKYFKTTLNQSKTISKLISNIQKLCLLNKEELELINIDVFHTLAEACEEVRQNYPKRCIKINQSMSESEVLVKSYQLLRDVFFNIIDNAIKFDPHDGVIIDIKYSITEDGEYWKLEFLDNGPGIPDNLKSRIFNGFEINIGNGNCNGSSRGSGLGLVVVKEIIHRCGGEVWVEDRVKTGDELQFGCNFVIILPRGLVG